MTESERASIEHATQAWIRDIVIGLGLCPFAHAVVSKSQVRIVVCEARDTDGIAVTLADELTRLHQTDASELDTTLIVVPNCLQRFDAFLEFVDVAELILTQLRLGDAFQIATFHPEYQFADVAANDVSNFTNRSPYPILHLLREDSVAHALAHYPDPDAIFERNIERMRALTENEQKTLFSYLRRKS
jgi:uncharacterized protein